MNEIAKAPDLNVALIKRTVAPGATDDQLAMFIHDCNRRGVHPLDKLIIFTNAGGKYTPITTIDYMRSRAAESGEMAGSDDAFFLPLRAESEEPPRKPSTATVTVYRLTNGRKYAYSATARFNEYYRNTPTWNHMPHTMLAKCAEALALRKAFPHQLAGLYTREEMQQAGVEDDTESELITDELLEIELDKRLAAAAEQGLNALQEVWDGLIPREKKLMEAAKNEKHKPRAIEVNARLIEDSSPADRELAAGEGGERDEHSSADAESAAREDAARPTAATRSKGARP